MQPAMASGEPPDAELDVPEAIDPAMVEGQALGRGRGGRRNFQGCNRSRKKRRNAFQKKIKALEQQLKHLNTLGRARVKKFEFPKHERQLQKKESKEKGWGSACPQNERTRVGPSCCNSGIGNFQEGKKKIRIDGPVVEPEEGPAKNPSRSLGT